MGGACPVCIASRVSTVHAPEVVAAEVEDELPGLDPSLLHGHLNLRDVVQLGGPFGSFV